MGPQTLDKGNQRAWRLERERRQNVRRKYYFFFGDLIWAE
jgi:hypothetical protein